MARPDSNRGTGERVTLMTLDNQPPENMPTNSPAMDTATGSMRVLDAYTPNTPPTASTLEDLLALEGYTPADIITCRIKGRLVKVVKDPELRCWKVTEDGVDGKSVFGLVPLEGRVSDKINGITREKAAKERGERAAKGKGKAGVYYIVDRPGDPGYKDWVMKVLKPRVKGSALLSSEPKPETEDTNPFGWMSREWKRGYSEDTNLGQLAKNQAAAINNHPDRHTWGPDIKTISVSGYEFKLKDTSRAAEQPGIVPRQLCKGCHRDRRRCRSCTSCPQCSTCRATSACGTCPCCQFTCCCRSPPDHPDAVHCRYCGACGRCGCCLGICCCGKKLDPRVPPVEEGVGCGRCRGEREMAREGGTWARGKGRALNGMRVAGEGVLVCEPVRMAGPGENVGSGGEGDGGPPGGKRFLDRFRGGSGGAGVLPGAEEVRSSGIRTPPGLPGRCPGYGGTKLAAIFESEGEVDKGFDVAEGVDEDTRGGDAPDEAVAGSESPFNSGSGSSAETVIARSPVPLWSLDAEYEGVDVDMGMSHMIGSLSSDATIDVPDAHYGQTTGKLSNATDDFGDSAMAGMDTGRQDSLSSAGTLNDEAMYSEIADIYAREQDILGAHLGSYFSDEGRER